MAKTLKLHSKLIMLIYIIILHLHVKCIKCLTIESHVVLEQTTDRLQTLRTQSMQGTFTIRFILKQYYLLFINEI